LSWCLSPFSYDEALPAPASNKSCDDKTVMRKSLVESRVSVVCALPNKDHSRSTLLARLQSNNNTLHFVNPFFLDVNSVICTRNKGKNVSRQVEIQHDTCLQETTGSHPRIVFYFVISTAFGKRVKQKCCIVTRLCSEIHTGTFQDELTNKTCGGESTRVHEWDTDHQFQLRLWLRNHAIPKPVITRNSADSMLCRGRDQGAVIKQTRKHHPYESDE
jgi:hypothetical protein